MERRALVRHTAVPLYAAALAGFDNDPVGLLQDRRPFLHFSEWLLAHPEAMMCEPGVGTTSTVGIHFLWGAY